MDAKKELMKVLESEGTAETLRIIAEIEREIDGFEMGKALVRAEIIELAAHKVSVFE